MPNLQIQIFAWKKSENTHNKKTFDNVTSVHIHQAGKHKDLELTSKQCKICHKIFSGATFAAFHMKMAHGDPKPLECEVCQLKLKSHKTLKIHMNSVHNNIKRFGCKNCEERFNSSTVRNKHIINLHLMDVS